jgi:RNA polymerase sigma-70 factor, ECF subfamily
MVEGDDALVAKAAMGDGGAFDELVRRHRVRVYRMVWTVTGSERDVEDMVQEVFIRAFLAVRGFRGESTFRTWLHRITMNVIRSHEARGRQRADTCSLHHAAEDADGGVMVRGT